MRTSTCSVTNWFPLQVTRTPGYLGPERVGWLALGASVGLIGGIELIIKKDLSRSTHWLRTTITSRWRPKNLKGSNNHTSFRGGDKGKVGRGEQKAAR